MSEQPEPDQSFDQSAGRSNDQSGYQHHELAVSDLRIAAAVDRLDTLAERPPAEHVEIYEEVHAVLQDSLAEAQGDQWHQPPGGAAR